MKKSNVMVIGAHPDDVEFGCGGTILKHKNNGDFVVYVCMTNSVSYDGVNGAVLRTADQNKEETKNAAVVLKCDMVHFLPFNDLHVPFSFESVSELEKIIKQYDIDTIYTHWAGDANQDHIATFKTTMAAARYVPNVFCYEQIPVPRMSENQMDINYYVDITDTFDQKVKASLCHDSQIRKYTQHGFNVPDNLELLAKFRGIQAKCKYAEAFKIIKQVW
jgi:LmbE family N-acetylglucosaminyl deacetylase